MQHKFELSPSFSMLLLAGFMLVAVPLLGSIFGIHYLLDNITQRSQRSVNVSAELILVSRQLTEAGQALQRAAGHYFVLEDPALKERLSKTHQRFVDTLGKLRELLREEQQPLAELAALESGLFTRILAADQPGPSRIESFRTDFDRLNQAQAAIAEQTSQAVQRQISLIKDLADQAQQDLVWQAAVLILVYVALVIFLSWFISLPVQQLAEAISRLGKNDLETESTIRGPRDMIYLGQQLDWLRRRLKELEASKLRFFQEVSHELKTPLTNLLEALALLNDRVVGELTEQQAEIIRIMLSSAADLQHLIEDLLSYNQALRLTEGARRRFSLSQLVDEARSRFDLLVRAKNLQVIDSTGSIALVTDHNGLLVTVENLLSNAVKFSPEGGLIEVLAEVVADALRIVVRDQGTGVPQEDLAQLFQPFFIGSAVATCSAAAKAVGSGCSLKSSGLGLAIAKAHVEGLGGQLTLISMSGWGACFQIILPRTVTENVQNG